jgi:3-hydroxybutyryl-CoA dehydrogenase
MADILIEPIEQFGLSKKDKRRTLFSKIGVVGCGTEGQNIARIASFYGIEVVCIDLSQEKIEQAYLNISQELDRRIENWGLTPSEKRAIMSRIKGSCDYASLSGCDCVIEAVRTDFGQNSLDYRHEVFRLIEDNVAEDTIIATNTTSNIITELSTELRNKERCVGLHFFVSSPDAKVVEVIRGIYTSDEVFMKVNTFVRMVNRTPIPVEESAGLVSIRLLLAMLNEACEALLQGVATLQDIDTTMSIGFGMRMGPFTIADKLGLDKIMYWMDNLHAEYGAIKYKTSPLIKKLVRAKHYGQRVGKGFFVYDENNKKIGENVSIISLKTAPEQD